MSSLASGLVTVELTLNSSLSIRLRAVSYFSLQSYCTRSLSTQAARPLVVRNEGVTWFAIALDDIRTDGLLREKADYKQSIVNR